MTATAERQRIGNTLAATGAALGVVAGIIQATIGASIPDWTGAKTSPSALGALTVVLSLVAAAGCGMSRRPHVGAGALVAGQKPKLAGALIALGTVPFAVLTWMALVPVLLVLVAVALATTLFRQAAAPVEPLTSSPIP